MFTITSRPPASALAISSSSSYATHRRHPEELEAMMDVDGEDAGEGFGLGRGESSTSGGRTVVGPGEAITSAKEYMRGHGTYVEDEQVVSSVAGTIERVNKLISVKPLKSRYTPEVGDLVIGRIVEVGSSRWKVDANARQDAVLMLSSVNLPGGVQRRKVEQDALKMREFLAEGDLLVAEVQAFFGDGAMSLHTRSLKYGKLRNGQLVVIPPHLIRRLKSHFHHLHAPCGPRGVDVIIGLNGLVWVAQGTPQDGAESGAVGGAGASAGAGAGAGAGAVGSNATVASDGLEAEGVYSNINDDVAPDSRAAISTIAMLIRLFGANDVPLSDTLLLEAYRWVAGRRAELGASTAVGLGGQQGAGAVLSPYEQARLLVDVVGVDIATEYNSSE